MASKNLGVRSVEEKVWLMARSKAVGQGLNMGQVITELLRLWVDGKVKIRKERKVS